MAAVSLTDPLCKPCSYNSYFKGNDNIFNPFLNKMRPSEGIYVCNFTTYGMCFVVVDCLQLRCM